MNGKIIKFALILACASLPLALLGCETAHGDPAQEAPPAATVIQGTNLTTFTVEHPEQYSLATAAQYQARSELSVTGTVLPDISRTVPVISLASGRVVEIRARLGDTVQKDQVVLRVRSDDVGLGFDAYQKAVHDELLARKQLDRAKDMYEHGAIAQQDLEIAQDAEDDALTSLNTTTEHLRLLGNDPDKPNSIVDIVAPISGVITDQEVTNAASVQAYAAPSPFTISDLSSVWVVCDVHENDLPSVRLGDTAEIRLNAYPDRMFTGRISNIGAILDPNIRTAKVRLEVANPGIMRLGMFVTAKFHGAKEEMHTQIPATAVLHLRDRDWVYVPAGGGSFRRVEVVDGGMLANNMQEVVSGITPGMTVVANALVLENTIEQQ